MSLVPTWVRIKNKWYENLVIYDKDKTFFICFDDEDPPEIVVKEKKEVGSEDLIKSCLQKIKIKARIISKPRHHGRAFPTEWKGFDSAISADIQITSLPDPKNFEMQYDKKSNTQPETQGVYYALR